MDLLEDRTLSVLSDFSVVLPSVSAQGVCFEATCVMFCVLLQMAKSFAKRSALVQLSVRQTLL